jgi:magnesium transporter
MNTPSNLSRTASASRFEAPPGLYQPETAGRHLVQRIPTARADDSVATVIASLSGQSYESIDAVYVLDDQQRLQGLVRLQDLLGVSPHERIGQVMNADPPTVLPDEDQEKIALLALKHRLAAVPVVDAERRLIGEVPDLALIEILRREHIEDMHRLAGILRETDHAHQAIEGAPASRLRRRLPWLIVGLAGSILATFVMASFEQALERRVAIAFFIPAIVYLADAIGTQTEAIVVRYLSVSHAPLGRLLAGEVLTGLLLGACLGLIIFPLVVLGFGDARLALAVSLAVLLASACAAVLGLILPWLLSWIGRDPAFGSGPVATIVQDVLSLLVYLVIVVLLVG